MSDKIVVDVEIQKKISQVPNGWNDTHLLGVSCAVVYENRTGLYRVYGDRDDDLKELMKRLEKADEIWGYNIWRFDFPVIYRLPSRDRFEPLRSKTRDILMGIWRSVGLNPEQFTDLHKGYGLDVITGETFGKFKSGHGAVAPALYQEGNWGKLVDYCINDVYLEMRLAAFVQTYGYVIGQGKIIRVTPQDCIP